MLIPIIIGAASLVISIFFFVFAFKLNNKRNKINNEINLQNKEWEKRNEELKLENLKLGEESARRHGELASLAEQELQIVRKIEGQNIEVQKAFENYCEILDTYYDLKENEFDTRMRALQGDFESRTEALKRESSAALEQYMDTLERYYKETEIGFDKAMQIITSNIESHQAELEKIRATYAATKEAQRREEEMALQADFYSLHLTPIEQDTIALIEELKPRLPEPRVLSMLIWTTYFQKQMGILCNNVLGSGIVCGIYKITNKKSGMCYIGQAVDVATRWKTHAKCGLGIDTPAQNKLYRAMQADGLINFTFELLEVCSRAQLNEKEKYYIELYQSYTFGYNSTGGNK